MDLQKSHERMARGEFPKMCICVAYHPYAIEEAVRVEEFPGLVVVDVVAIFLPIVDHFGMK